MQNELLTQPIPTLVVRKAIPMVFGVLAILLFTLVDTWFISLLGTEPLAAMSFSFPVTFIVSSMAMGMGIGLAAVVGRLLGSGDHDKAQRFTTDSLILSTLLVIVLGVTGLLVMDPLFRLLGAPASVMVHIRAYMGVWFLVIPLLVIPMVGNSAIRASGDVKTPSVVMLVAGVVNGVLDPVFIFVFDLGVRGAALATGVSWLITFVVAFYVLKNRLHLLTLEWPQRRLLFAHWRQLLSIGMPAAVAQMLNPMANAIQVAILAGFGVAGVAAFGASSRIEAIFLVFIMALGSVMPTVLGQNIGAGHMARSAKTIRYTIHLVIGLYLAMYAVVFILAPYLAAMFTEDAEVAALATRYLRILPLSYAWLGVGIVASQILNVLHRPMISLWINVLRLFVFLVPCAWLGGRVFGPLGVFSGVALAHTVSGILIYLYILKVARDLEQSPSKHQP